jgi:aryl-alcohol dehydrogenase-like predicted oxidoreductase
MRYKLLGKTGLQVSELCLGTMTFGEDWDFGASLQEAKQIFTLFCDKGGNFIDTANMYTDGTSEKFVGEFIDAERDYFILSTKYSLNTRPNDPNGGGNHRKNMNRSLENSLKRLKTDYIDVYWLHIWDFLTPVEEIMRGLEDLVRSGKVLYIGVSDTPAWVISQANMLAELRGWAAFIGLQIEYNLIQRTAERDLLPMARSLGLGVTAWAPLAGGVLTGKYVKKGTDLEIVDSKRGDWLNSERLHEKSFLIVEALAKVATELDCSIAQVALNWIRQQPGGIIPIIAGRTSEQIRENLDCLEFRIEPEQMSYLNEVSKIDLGFPHEFLASEPLQNALFGDQRALLDTRPRQIQEN